MNHWQPMIDRCQALSVKVDELLTRRAAVATSYDGLTIYKIDDLETIYFALRHTKHRLEVENTTPQGSCLMGVSAPVCHCGKDGHAINSINCPVHGTAALKMARDLANWEI